MIKYVFQRRVISSYLLQEYNYKIINEKMLKKNSNRRIILIIEKINYNIAIQSTFSDLSISLR